MRKRRKPKREPAPDRKAIEAEIPRAPARDTIPEPEPIPARSRPTIEPRKD